MTWSYVNKRWERNYTYDSPGIRTFLVSNVSDILYGLRTINDVVGTISITWKEFEVVFDGAVHSVPIDTNSAVSNFVFNPTLRQINLTASGPSGTVGTANITVSKQLVPEGYEFKVYLDGEQCPFTLEENATCYFIHLIYIHSQHQITISIVDLTPPILSVMSPSDGSEVKSSNVEVTWSGSDIASGIGHYEIRLDDTSWIDVGADTSHAFTKVSDCSHIVYVKAVDKAGNTNEAQISFNVNTSLIGGPGWIDDLVVFGTVVAIIMLTLFLVRRRR